MSIGVRDIIDALIKHKNVLIYGPPGTGKTHLMQEVSRQFEAELRSHSASAVMLETDEERAPLSIGSIRGITTRWVTFHQGYSYEDFVLGMRPESDEAAGFRIRPKPGVLLEIAAEALNGAGLLLIDEINRGNTSRIFGEFITLMEPDKRLDEEGNATPTTVLLTLPYLSPEETVSVETSKGTVQVGREFSMPYAVYTLASMNSVDKSISPIDTALRRRFHIINLAPTETGLKQAVGLSASAAQPPLARVGADLEASDLAAIAVAVLKKVNRSIGLFLGPDFCLGQWYLAPLATLEKGTAQTALAEAWLYRILPQLLELFHGREEQIISVLGEKHLRHKGSGLRAFEPEEDELELGATGYVEVQAPPPKDFEVIEFLQLVAGAEKANASPATDAGAVV